MAHKEIQVWRQGGWSRFIRFMPDAADDLIQDTWNNFNRTERCRGRLVEKDSDNTYVIDTKAAAA